MLANLRLVVPDGNGLGENLREQAEEHGAEFTMLSSLPAEEESTNTSLQSLGELVFLLQPAGAVANSETDASHASMLRIREDWLAQSIQRNRCLDPTPFVVHNAGPVPEEHVQHGAGTRRPMEFVPKEESLNMHETMAQAAVNSLSEVKRPVRKKRKLAKSPKSTPKYKKKARKAFLQSKLAFPLRSNAISPSMSVSTAVTLNDERVDSDGSSSTLNSRQKAKRERKQDPAGDDGDEDEDDDDLNGANKKNAEIEKKDAASEKPDKETPEKETPVELKKPEKEIPVQNAQNGAVARVNGKDSEDHEGKSEGEGDGDDDFEPNDVMNDDDEDDFEQTKASEASSEEGPGGTAGVEVRRTPTKLQSESQAPYDVATTQRSSRKRHRATEASQASSEATRQEQATPGATRQRKAPPERQQRAPPAARRQENALRNGQDGQEPETAPPATPRRAWTPDEDTVLRAADIMKSKGKVLRANILLAILDRTEEEQKARLAELDEAHRLRSLS